MELLFERPGLPRFDLPPALAARYGGALGFPRQRLFANFVASVDGVVALAGPGESGHVISGGSEDDRFVMGLLRACADAVLIGAGTFRHSPDHRWHAEAIHPPAAADFAELRRRLGLRAQPPLVLVTASGELDLGEPALRDAIIVTTPAGQARLRGKLPEGARLLGAETDPIRMPAVLASLAAEGFSRVLTEGGPSLFGELLAGGLVDEIFLTTAPRLFGPADGRKSLIHGVDLAGAELELLGVRRSGSHLLLRYQVVR
jgi:riboflavin biosynthesis pyrimidine reductase